MPTAHRRLLSMLLTTSAVCVLLTSGGCTTTAAGTTEAMVDPLATTPDDLTIDLRVLTAASGSRDTTSEAAEPARFVLLPDGALHAGRDGLHQQRSLPPEIRRLDRRQIAEVWSLITELGLADPDDAPAIRNPLLIDRPSSGTLYVLSIRGRDRWWQHRRAAPDAQAGEPAMARLAAELAELAWLDDAAEHAALVAPRRYDFGPDPYARYRGTDNGTRP